MEAFSSDPSEKESLRFSLTDDDGILVNCGSYLKKLCKFSSQDLWRAIAVLRLLHNSEICIISFLLKHHRVKSKEVIIYFTFKLRAISVL